MDKAMKNYPPVPPTNGKAIAALVIGILSIIIVFIGFILGIIGIVFANKSFKEIDMGATKGKGMAIAGLVTSIVGTVLHAFSILGFLAFIII